MKTIREVVNIIKMLLKNLNYRILLNIIISIILILIVLITLLFFKINQEEKDKLSFTLINKYNNQITQEFKNLLMPINRNLSIIQKWGKSGLLDKMKDNSINSSFIPILEQITHISSIMIVNESGLEYLIVRDGNTWVTKTNKNRKKSKLWQRWENSDKKIDEWQSDLEYYPNLLYWLDKVLKEYPENAIFWTRPNIFYATNQSVSTGLIKWKKDGKSKLVAINVLLNNVTQLVKDRYLNNNGKVFIISNEGQLIAFSEDKISKSKNQKAVKNQKININKVIFEIIKYWKSNKKGTNPFIYKSYNNSWIVKFKKLKEQEGSLLIGIIAEEKDLVSEITTKKYFYVYLLIAIAFIIGMVYFYIIVKLRKIAKLNKNKKEIIFSEEKIKKIIENGESSNVEFKSSLRWHYYKESASKKVEEIILKSIAAFNNAEGGILLIGINDNGEIMGLENDYKTLQGNDKDHFELHLRNLINSAYGLDFATNNIKVVFPIINNKEICIVNVKKGKVPLYTKITDKKGFKTEKLYVRSGNSSQELNKPSDIANYLNTRFNN